MGMLLINIKCTTFLWWTIRSIGESMKTSYNIILVMVLAVSLAACDKLNQNKTMGEKLDATTNKATTEINDTSKTVNDNFNDSSITAKVRVAILNEPNLKSFQININTVNGVVTLDGAVNNKVEKDRVYDIANAISGVKETKNNIIIKTSSEKTN
jgi:osmotically-inducible protein OsmY